MKRFLFLLLLIPLFAFSQSGLMIPFSSSAVADYETRVTAAGGTLQTGDREALLKMYNTWTVLGVQEKILDYGPFLGGFNGAFVKLKYADPNYKSILNNGTAAFVSGDYSENVGLTTTVNTKRGDLGFNCTAVGMTYQDFSIGMFMPSLGSTAGITLMGLNPTSGAIPLSLGKNISSKNNIPSGSQSVTPIPRYKPTSGNYTWRWFTAKNDTLNGGWDYNRFFPVNQSLSVNFDINSNLTLFSGNNKGVSGNGQVGAYWAGLGMSYGQTARFIQSVEQFLVYKGRIPITPLMLWLGNSISNGTGSSDDAHRFTYLLADYFGHLEKNLGVPGSRARVDFGTVPGIYQRRGSLSYYYNVGEVGIMGGTNDMCFTDVTTNGDPTILADYQTKLEAIIDYVHGTMGIPLNKIYLSSAPLNNHANANSTKQTAYRDKARAAAVSRHCMWVDNYQYLLDNGGVAANVSGDQLHPNDTGHANIAYNIYNNSTLQYKMDEGYRAMRGPIKRIKTQKVRTIYQDF